MRQTPALFTVLPLAAALSACGPQFDPVSLINDYRAVAIATDSPDTVPDAILTARIIDADPEARTPAPTVWSVCPYSFGSGVEYACLVPESELVIEGGGPTLEVDLATAEFGEYRGLTEALRPAAAALTEQVRRFDANAPDLSAELLLLQGVDVYIKVESGPPDARQFSVRAVRVAAPPEQRCALAQQLAAACDGNSSDAANELCPQGFDFDHQVKVACESAPNTNPDLALFEVAGLSGTATATAGSKLTLRVLPAEGARQPFYLDDGNALCPDSDGDAEVRGGPCVEEIYYRWYTTGGELENAVTFESDRTIDRDSVLTVPDEPGPLTVLVVAFDGRGGVTALRRELQVVAAP